MNIIVDGDPIVYRAGFAAEPTEYATTFRNENGETFDLLFDSAKECSKFQESNPSLDLVSREAVRTPEPVEHALYNAKVMLEGVLKFFDKQENFILVVLSGDSNFRDDIAVTREYKANRDKTHRPAHGPAIKQYMLDNWPSTVTEGEEADDLVAYTHYGFWKKGEDSCICTIDKDLNMVPGYHYDWVREEYFWCDPWYSMKFFYQQLISGDSTDNIVGIPGVGAKGAEKALADCTSCAEMREVVFRMYGEAYPDVHYSGVEQCQEVLLEMGRLLWMRRSPNEMWHPKDSRIERYEAEANACYGCKRNVYNLETDNE